MCLFSFSDIENVDWPTIKNTLSSADSWSICRLGDYFVQTGNKKRPHPTNKTPRKEKMMKNNDQNEKMIKSNGDSSTEDFDMLDDIYTNQPLFRLMPQTTSTTNTNIPAIVEPGKSSDVQLIPKCFSLFISGDDSDKILHHYSTFSIDWFTDNNLEAPLRVIPSKHRSGINSLVEDSSVLDVSCGTIEIEVEPIESFLAIFRSRYHSSTMLADVH